MRFDSFPDYQIAFSTTINIFLCLTLVFLKIAPVPSKTSSETEFMIKV